MASSNGGSENPKLKDSKVYSRKSSKGVGTDEVVLPQPENLVSEDANSLQQQLLTLFDDDSSSPNRANAGGKLGFLRQENRVTFNLSSKTKKEMRELRKKLEGELDLVKDLVRKIESDKNQKVGGNVGNHCVGLRKRVHSEVEAGGPLQSRPLNQLNMSLLENSRGTDDGGEKEKRTPKANQFYQNADFLLAKDKFPPSDKKSKSNGKKLGGGSEAGVGRFSPQLLKSCNALLERLMKHKHGWVFNKPVDAKALGLSDYFDIIKNPMDLGTIKLRLSTNVYKNPREFAEDVRLTFQNAMTYNAKGQDVYLMAEQLLQMFEEKWDVIEADYLLELKKLVGDHEGSEPTPTSKKSGLPAPISKKSGVPTPTSKKFHKARQPPVEAKRDSEKSESIPQSPDLNTKIVNLARPGRPAVPKKPKAKDLNKREMTYDEKQKLSTNLQSLPGPKLENVVHIIKKRNPSLCQHDDEIEVDIESFDNETLWELDRFITNYKKGLSKNKKKTDLSTKSNPVAEKGVQKEAVPGVAEAQKKAKSVDKGNSSPVRVGKQVNNTTHSSKSGSSSSGSGSTSSGSDSESSSG